MKAKQKEGKTLIRTDVLQDGKLSWNAIGIFIYLCSFPGSLEMADLFVSPKSSSRDITSGVDELVTAGYVKREGAEIIVAEGLRCCV